MKPTTKQLVYVPDLWTGAQTTKGLCKQDLIAHHGWVAICYVQSGRCRTNSKETSKAKIGWLCIIGQDNRSQLKDEPPKNKTNSVATQKKTRIEERRANFCLDTKETKDWWQSIQNVMNHCFHRVPWLGPKLHLWILRVMSQRLRVRRTRFTRPISQLPRLSCLVRDFQNTNNKKKNIHYFIYRM